MRKLRSADEAMTDPMALFDADIYTARGKTPRSKRRMPPPKQLAETVPVVVDQQWKYSHSSTPGIVHCASATTEFGGGYTYCKLIGTPLTYAPGETVLGCAACVKHGAPVRS